METIKFEVLKDCRYFNGNEINLIELKNGSSVIARNGDSNFSLIKKNGDDDFTHILIYYDIENDKHIIKKFNNLKAINIGSKLPNCIICDLQFYDDFSSNIDARLNYEIEREHFSEISFKSMEFYETPYLINDVRIKHTKLNDLNFDEYCDFILIYARKLHPLGWRGIAVSLFFS